MPEIADTTYVRCLAKRVLVVAQRSQRAPRPCLLQSAGLLEAEHSGVISHRFFSRSIPAAGHGLHVSPIFSINTINVAIDQQNLRDLLRLQIDYADGKDDCCWSRGGAKRGKGQVPIAFSLIHLQSVFIPTRNLSSSCHIDFELSPISYLHFVGRVVSIHTAS